MTKQQILETMKGHLKVDLYILAGLLKQLDNQPTHIGRWINEYHNNYVNIVCSECGTKTLTKTNYCSHCGAFMKNSQEEN